MACNPAALPLRRVVSGGGAPYLAGIAAAAAFGPWDLP